MSVDRVVSLICKAPGSTRAPPKRRETDVQDAAEAGRRHLASDGKETHHDAGGAGLPVQIGRSGDAGLLPQRGGEVAVAEVLGFLAEIVGI